MKYLTSIVKYRIAKLPLPMFYINLKHKSNNKWSPIMRTKISFELPSKKCEIAQCTRCQRHGHTKSLMQNALKDF